MQDRNVCMQNHNFACKSIIAVHANFMHCKEKHDFACQIMILLFNTSQGGKSLKSWYIMHFGLCLQALRVPAEIPHFAGFYHF